MRRARILVVDDEKMNLEILSRLLGAQGHEVSGAGDAEAGAQILGANTFDLVLLDLALPGQTGLQALAGYKKLTRAPIYIMSGQTDEDTRKDSVMLGAAGFLPKPFSTDSLELIVAQLPER